MKRNMVPLLGIAFVVAIISTGVFYGLFAGKLRSASPELNGRPILVAAKELERGKVLQSTDLRVSQMRGALGGSFSNSEQLIGATLVMPIKENEPFLRDRVMLRAPASGESGGDFPSGMRAISIRVAESDGVVNLLHAGSRIDIQAVSDRNGNVELRTVLQNVEVLSVIPPADPSRNGNRVVAVLTRAEDADAVALADSAGRVRVAVRNPFDEGVTAHPAMTLASVFRASTERTSPANKPIMVRSSAAPQVRLEMQLLAATAAAAGELKSKVEHAGNADALRVASFPENTNAAELLDRLKERHEIDVLSSRSLTASPAEPGIYHVSAAPYRLRVKFSASEARGGDVSLRVIPEIHIRTGNGIETRQYDAALTTGGSLLLEGFAADPAGRRALERLFPGHEWSNRELLIFITAKEPKAEPISAQARTSGGR